MWEGHLFNTKAMSQSTGAWKILYQANERCLIRWCGRNFPKRLGFGYITAGRSTEKIENIFSFAAIWMQSRCCTKNTTKPMCTSQPDQNFLDWTCFGFRMNSKLVHFWWLNAIVSEAPKHIILSRSTSSLLWYENFGTGLFMVFGT